MSREIGSAAFLGADLIFLEGDDPIGGGVEVIGDDFFSGEVVEGGESLEEDGADDEGAVKHEGEEPDHSFGIAAEGIGDVGVIELGGEIAFSVDGGPNGVE